MPSPTLEELVERLNEDAERIETVADERYFPAHLLAHAERYADDARQAASALLAERARVEKMREGLRQAALELGEAVPLIRAQFPRTAEMFAEAAENVRLLLLEEGEGLGSSRTNSGRSPAQEPAKSESGEGH